MFPCKTRLFTSGIQKLAVFQIYVENFATLVQMDGQQLKPHRQKLRVLSERETCPICAAQVEISEAVGVSQVIWAFFTKQKIILC
jgi:hypothetical protein